MELPVRKHTRLPEYDYSQPGYYFITICTHNRQPLFVSFVGAHYVCARLPTSVSRSNGYTNWNKNIRVLKLTVVPSCPITFTSSWRSRAHTQVRPYKR